ncbi:hypothetical protein [Streptomyces sp. DH37]|uniref:hypothetical protein n=1 Tax=Streptomyces sp. DH37 TaxID=3040122 RepID=UPI0024434526|nr:hypothetical protein [Streptomyces sp. DH37]MDG9702408.1 hypothetical protein [Streptomyces sp. DH37]
MRKGTLEYEQALDAVVEILRERARRGAEPLSYKDLSDELAGLGHHVPYYKGPMPYLLEDASARDNPDGRLPMLSALVVSQSTRRPSGGFFSLARSEPYERPGDDTALWVRELKDLAEHYAGN